jgi:hypothetical protein
MKRRTRLTVIAIATLLLTTIIVLPQIIEAKRFAWEASGNSLSAGLS